MALHLLRLRHKYLNPSLVSLFSTSSSCVRSQSPPSNFLITKKPLTESCRRYSSDIVDWYSTRQRCRVERAQAEETKSRVETEKPVEEKRRKVGKPKVEQRKQMDTSVNSLRDAILKTGNLFEQKPMEEKARRVGKPKVEQRKQIDTNVNLLGSPTLKTGNQLFEQKPIPMEEKPRRCSTDDVFARHEILQNPRENDEETQSRVGKTEQPKVRPRRNQVLEEKPMEETQSRVGKTEQPNQVLAEKPMGETQSRPAKLSGSRRTKGLTALRNALKNQPDYICRVAHAMYVLNGLSRVKKWSPLYLASMDHLMADVTHRQAFLTFSDPDDTVRYLRYKTKKT